MDNSEIIDLGIKEMIKSNYGIETRLAFIDGVRFALNTLEVNEFLEFLRWFKKEKYTPDGEGEWIDKFGNYITIERIYKFYKSDLFSLHDKVKVPGKYVFEKDDQICKVVKVCQYVLELELQNGCILPVKKWNCKRISGLSKGDSR